MNRALPVYCQSSRRTHAVFRLRRALAVSVFLHLAFSAAAPVRDAPRRGAQALEAAPIVARLESPALAPPITEPVEFPAPPGSARRGMASVSEHPAALPPKVTATKTDRAETLALPPLDDPTVYTARDLDSYPRPVVPLDAGRLDDAAAGKAVSVRIEVVIDEHGIVNSVALAGPGPAGLVEKELRNLLAATRFIPARKDGRAVKSRMLLSISLM